jgi:transposase InsO family protein
VIREHAGNLRLSQACRALNVRRQGYYEWAAREQERLVGLRQDEVLTAKIKNIFYESKRRYGARKIRRLLRREGWIVSRKRVRRLMLASGLVPVTFRRHMATTDSKHGLAVFPNLLNRDFKAETVNRVWVSDFTYIRTDEGWLYLCTVLDICSRRVVGWAVSQTIDRNLAISALENAVKNRRPDPGFIFHTDRGSQYASADFRNAVARYGGLQSMSGPGSPYDNACAESFFRSLKVECVDPAHFATRRQATEEIAEYMLFYNRRRIHASLNYRTPAEFERDLASLLPAS